MLRRVLFWTVAVGAVALLGYFLLWPVLSMLTSSLFNKEGQFGLHGYVQFFSEPAYRESLFNTLWLGAAVTLLSLVLGAGLALAAARFSFPLAACLGVLPLLTLVIPDVVVAAAWIVVVLPAPFGPVSPYRRPAEKVAFTSSKRTFEPSSGGIGMRLKRLSPAPSFAMAPQIGAQWLTKPSAGRGKRGWW